MEYVIRRMKREDSKAYAHVVTVSWNETYKGIVPDEELQRLKNNEEERANKIYEIFDDKSNYNLVLEVDNEVVGFVRYGKAEDNDFENCGEIIAFYIINKYHGYGFGRKLFENAVEELKKQGFDKMIIACLKGNKTNEFYKHMGGKYIKDGVYKRLNLPENIYYFDI